MRTFPPLATSYFTIVPNSNVQGYDLVNWSGACKMRFSAGSYFISAIVCSVVRTQCLQTSYIISEVHKK